MIKVKITGIDSIKKIPKEVKNGIEKGLNKARLFYEGDSKRNFRGHSVGELFVRSGHLRRSIYSKNERLGFLVGSPVVYAHTHQYGDSSRNIPARPFIKIETEKVVDFIMNSIEREL